MKFYKYVLQVSIIQINGWNIVTTSEGPFSSLPNQQPFKVITILTSDTMG